MPVPKEGNTRQSGASARLWARSPSQALLQDTQAESVCPYGTALEHIRLARSCLRILCNNASKCLFGASGPQYGHRSACPATSDFGPKQSALIGLLANKLYEQVGRLATQAAFRVRPMRLKHEFPHHSEGFTCSSVPYPSCQLNKERDSLIFLHGVPCACSYAVIHPRAYARKWVGMSFAQRQDVGAGERFRQTVFILRSKDRGHDFRNVPIPSRVAKLGNSSAPIEC